MFDPAILLAFMGGLALAYVIGRVVREILRRRRAAKAGAGPDTRSRQVKRAHKRRLKKNERY